MYDKLQSYLAQKGLTIDEVKVATRLSIVDYLKKAKYDNKAFLDIAAPTAAQRNDQITKLTRQNIRIIRLLTNMLDGVD